MSPRRPLLTLLSTLPALLLAACGGSIGESLSSEALGHFALHAHVNLRGGIFADADKHEPRLNAAALEGLDALSRFGVNLLRDGAAVDEVAHGITAPPRGNQR
jgi:hypothetical protein